MTDLGYKLVVHLVAPLVILAVVASGTLVVLSIIGA